MATTISSSPVTEVVTLLQLEEAAQNKRLNKQEAERLVGCLKSILAATKADFLLDWVGEFNDLALFLEAAARDLPENEEEETQK